MSRRPPEAVSGRPFTHLAADLQDEAICRAAFRGRRDIHHVVDTAVYEGPGLIAGESEQDQRQANPAVLCKLLAPLAADDALEHVSLLQGCKAAAPHAMPVRRRRRTGEPAPRRPGQRRVHRSCPPPLRVQPDGQSLIQ